MPGFLQEIKRRNVFKVAVVYVIAGWVTMQVVDIMFPALNLPAWLTTAVVAFLLLGFPFALIFAWAFEITPEGIKREKDIDRDRSITPQTGQKLNRAAFVILSVAVGFLLLDKFVLDDASNNTVSQVAVTGSMPSIAVLPFVNMSGDAANEYFSDGLSEELLNLLAKIPKLHVAGRTSSFKFKGTNEDLRIIGEQLNVAHVLEGSVRKSGTRLRITAQLIDTESGFHLWSETYDRDMTDIFAIQDEISANVVAALRVKLLGDELVVANRGTENTEAYNLFLQGNYFLEHTNAENLQRAFDSYEEATEIDPQFARAYLGLAIALQQEVSGWAAHSGDESFIEGFKRVRAYADKAMAIDSNNSDAYVAQMVVASIADWDYVKALEYGQKALQLEPNNTKALGWMGSLMFFVGKPADAIKYMQRVIEIDPLDITSMRTLGDVYTCSGQTDLAIDAYNRALAIAPEMARLNGRIARALIFAGREEEAKSYVSKEPVEWVRELHEIILLGRAGKTDEWRAATTGFEDKYGVSNSYQLAEIYADIGDLDLTFKWLMTAVEVHDPGGIWATVMPFFDAAKKDPRWDDFIANFRL